MWPTPHFRGGRAWGSCRKQALPCELGCSRDAPACPLNLQPHRPPSWAPFSPWREEAPILVLSPHSPPEPPPKQDFSWAGVKRRLGEETVQQTGAQQLGLWSSVRTTSWHPTAQDGGGIWAALPNSLPRRVPRTLAEPALPFPCDLCCGGRRRRGLGQRSEGAPGLGGGCGAPQAQVQAVQAGRTRPRLVLAGEPSKAEAGGGWNGGGGRGSGILPAQDPRG